jgi:ribonuclease BN (tRNA processing enzyme)
MKTPAVIVAIAVLIVALPHAQPRSRVVMLGTGTPNANPDRFGPSVAIVVDDASYLVDFGVGVVRRAAAAERAGIKALNVLNLKQAFTTHLHSDHTLGLADLILTPWILERDAPLNLYGPRGLRAMANHLVAAYADDIRVRTTGGEPKHKHDPSVINVHEISPGVVFHDDRVDSHCIRREARRVAAGIRLPLPDAGSVDRDLRRRRSGLAHRGPMPPLRRARARGVFGGRIRQTSAGLAGVSRAISHLDARARRHRGARAAATA